MITQIKNNLIKMDEEYVLKIDRICFGVNNSDF